MKPDVIALDIGMPNLNGLEAAREILRENPKTKILFLTIYDTEQAVKSAVQIGAKGLILKSDAARELSGCGGSDPKELDILQLADQSSYVAADLRGNRRSAEKDTLTRARSKSFSSWRKGKAPRKSPRC